MNELTVHASPLPFSNKQVKLTVPCGASILDIVNQATNSDSAVGAIVMINGETIPMEYWDRVYPKPGNHNIALRVVPMGDDGGKNPLAIILTIAVLVAAPYLGNFAAFAFAGGMGPLTAGQVLLGKVITAGIGIIGQLAVSALAPPPSSSNQGTVSNPSESPTLFIEGAQNTINRYGVVPGNLGVNRMFPPQAALPYTETKDNDQYVRQLFTYGYGQAVEVTDLKIGETDLSEFSDIGIENRLEGNLHETTELYSNDVFQENYSVLISKAAGYIIRSTQIDSDEVIVDLTFASGLFQYNDSGKRISRRVQLELQYALSDESPQVWSPTSISYTDYPATTGITVTPVAIDIEATYVITRMDAVVIDKYSGIVSLVRGWDQVQPAILSNENQIRLADVFVTTTYDTGDGSLSTDIQVTDVRSSALFGTTFEDSGSFVPSKASSTTVDVTDGALLVNDLDIEGAQTESLRKSVRVKFPTAGQYDIRLRRITDDSTSDKISDDAFLSAIKSIKHQAPVTLEGINGSAIRIKATDQLNGTIEQFNAIVSTIIPDYDLPSDTWANRISSNPASLYRYVLQGAANDKALSDDQISLDDLIAWHAYCSERGYSYNRVIDYETSIDAVLRDIASAGNAAPAIVDGKRTVVVDNSKDTIAQMITPRNSWEYSAEMTYPVFPHAFRVQFRNADKGYLQDERIVYADGFDEFTATVFETLEYQSCTNADLAFKHARRLVAQPKLRPETHTFMMDVENLVALRGDRIKFVHDVPIVGIGDGRIKTVTTDSGSPELVTGFTIDDTVTVPSNSTFYTRVRLSDGTQLYKELTTSIGETSTFVFAVPFTIADTPSAGDLCYFVEAGGELDLLITRIEPRDDLTAQITAINYAQPDIENSESSSIPAFDSKITTPLEFIRPESPMLLEAQSNEDVMLVNSDGSFTPRAIFTLQNTNDDEIFTTIKVRVAGTSVFKNADIFEASPERVIITGLEDGKRYDIRIWYRRKTSTVYSLPLEMNNYLFVGASGTPSDPTNFKIEIDGSTAYFEWEKNDDIDHSHSILKFSNVFSGASYETAQIRKEKIFETRTSLSFIAGTYFIKHVDLSGNESENASVITTYNPGTIANAVAVVDEFNDSPALAGVKVNIVISDNKIVLEDTDLTDGYYYFNELIDLTDVFPASISSAVVANGVFINNLFLEDDLFALEDMFGGGGNDLFLEDDLFALKDMFGIGVDAWSVELQYSTTQTDPDSSPVEWTDWAPLEAGILEFWAIRFRIKLSSLEQNVSPQVSQLAVLVDMPDRIERGDDLTVLVAGTTITFSPEFKETPAVAITIQDGAVDDRIEFTSKTSGGFAFKVYNGTAMAYVQRTYDYIASGYGRKNT